MKRRAKLSSMPMEQVPSGWVVYILECGDKTLYTGITNDFPKRFAAHQNGKGARYTRSRGPLRCVYAEKADDKSQASKREAAIKRLSRLEKVTLIRNWK
jgi:putative endonuclease